MTKPGDEDHIEELLSQLQGIFGKLSKTESEEAETKEDLPTASKTAPTELPLQAPPLAPEPPPPLPEPTPGATEVFAEPKETYPELVIEPLPETPVPIIEPAPEPTPEPPAPVEIPERVPDPLPILETIPEPTPLPPPVEEPTPALTPLATEPAPMPTQVFSPPPGIPPVFANAEAPVEEGVESAGIFFPIGREDEAHKLADKLDTMSPTFTRVTFKLRVSWTFGYDPKIEWRPAILAKLQETPVKTVFVIVERPLEDARRRTLQSDLDALQMYFQEVALLSIEKKAFYTDLLLGLVFFFDSQKPSESTG